MRNQTSDGHEMADLILGYDWAATPLGAMSSWPQSLKTAVDIVLASGHAMQLAWGPERTVLYNDAYAPMLGKRHPYALGLPFRDAWPEIWEEIEPLVGRVFAGETIRFEAMPLLMTRNGSPEETWWNFSYSPVKDESGAITGLLNVTVDATQQVLAGRAKRERDESRRLQSAMLEVIPIGLALIGTDGRVILSNPEWDRFTPGGRMPSRDPDRGWRWRSWDIDGRLTEPGDYPGARALRGERCLPGVEFLYTDEAGIEIWTNVASVPLLDTQDRVAGAVSIIMDIDAAKRAEEALRKSEERQQFLLALSDALRPLGDADEIRLTVVIALGRHLGANRVAYAENVPEEETFNVTRNYVAGAAEVVGHFRYADYGPDILADLQSGITRVQPDIQNDPRLDEAQKQGLAQAQVGASLNVPLVKKGSLVAFLGVNYAGPHDFPAQEIDLVTEVADRTWAAVERARAEAALRTSEERFRALLTAGANSIYRMSPDWRFMYQLDSKDLAKTPEPIEDWIGKYILDADLPDVLAEIERAIRTRSLFELEHRVRLTQGGIGWVMSRAVPLLGPDGEITEWFGAGSDVTERRQAVEKLRERETDLARVQRIGRVGGLDIDIADGLRSWRSPEYRRLHGLPADHRQETHADWLSRVHPDDRDRAEQVLFAALKGGASVYASEYRIIRPSDGEIRWIEARADIERDAYGRAVRLVGAHIDVTEQKQVQEALRKSEERLRQFGEASQDVLWIRDAETLQWQYLTPAFDGIYGISREDALVGNNYRSWLDLILPEDRGRVTKSIQRVQTGAHVTFDYRIRRPRDGIIRWIRSTDFPIRDDTGKVTLIGGIGHDLTELREAELRLQTLIEGIPQLVWRAVDGGLWTWASPQWTDYTGQSSSESLGLGWLDALHPADRAAARDAWAHALDADGFEMDYRLRRAAGHDFRWFQTRAKPVRDEAGSIIEWLGTSTDIHDLRELQERQRILVGELQHRTRNLMAVVHAIADRTGETACNFADFRVRFHHRLEALARVQGLLSRLGETDRVTFDELIEAELAAMDGIAEKVTLDGPRGVRLRSSMVQTLAMALHELATNAVKYGALGQPQAQLAIRWRLESPDQRGRPWLHIDWRESGVHMPPADALPPGNGQGRELIEQALPYQLGARTRFELGPDGVRCAIALPVSTTNCPLEKGP